MNRDEFLKVYWKQYQLLERDLIQTDDYVSIDKDNYDTFSNQYTKLLLIICSEIDSIAEVLCSMYEEKVPFGIKNKLDALVEKYPKLKKYRVNTKFPYDIKNITPMDKFSDSISDWWHFLMVNLSFDAESRYNNFFRRFQIMNTLKKIQNRIFQYVLLPF